MREEEVERLRAIVRDCIGRHEYASATFYAGRVALATADPLDIYMEAQALLLAGHHRRALHLLTSSPPLLRDPRFRCLAAKCLVISFITYYLFFYFIFLLNYLLLT